MEGLSAEKHGVCTPDVCGRMHLSVTLYTLTVTGTLNCTGVTPAHAIPRVSCRRPRHHKVTLKAVEQLS